MGSSVSNPTIQKHLVIVGGSFAGMAMLESSYKDFTKITLIDTKDHYEFICTAARSLTDDTKDFGKNLIPFTQVLKNIEMEERTTFV